MEVPEGTSQSDALAHAREKYKDLYVPPKAPDTGLTGAAKASYQTLKGDIAALAGRAGLMDVEEAQKYQQERQAEAQKVFKPTEEDWSEAPFLKARELLGGSLPYMAAPIVAGLAAPVVGLGGVAGAAGLAGLASATQFAGSDLSRQMQEGKQLKDTDLLAAGAAAIPQAALDVVGFRYIPGIQKIFKSVGKEISEDAARKMLQQGTLRTAGQYIAGGAKIGGIEGATEAGQQFFERLQAGLNIADEDARKEYLDSFIGGAVLGGIASPAGVYGTRGQAKGVVEKADQAKADAAAAEQAKLDEAAAAAQAAQVEPVPPPVDATAEQNRLLNMRFEMENQQGILKRQLDDLRTQAQKETDIDKLAAISEQAKALQADINSYDPDKIKSQMSALKKENTSLTKDLKEATKAEDPQAIQTITEKIAQNDATAGELNDKLKAFSIKPPVARAPEELDSKIKKAQTALQKAKDEGDLEAVGKIAQNIKSFEEEKAKYPGAHVQEYKQRMAQYQKEREQRTQDTLYQETEAEKAEREIAESKGEPVKRQPYKEEMTSEEYEDRLAQNLVDLFTEQERPLPTKLTPAQRQAEAKRVAKIDEYDKKFKEAIAYYEQLNAEAEEKARIGAKGKGAKLYGERGELLQKGQELQDALAAMMKAKGDLINAIPKGQKTPVESAKGLAAAQDVNLLDLTDTIDSMRKGEFFGGPNPQAATGSLATKAMKARKFLDQYIQATVSSIDFARQGKGLAPLTDAEKTDIVDQIDGLMDGKIQRATGKLARALKAGEEAAPEDTAMRDAFNKAGFKMAPLEQGEREIKTGFSREEFKDVQRFAEGLKNKYTNKPVKEIGKLQRIPAGVSAKEAARIIELEKRVAEKKKAEAAKPKPTTKERVAKEQQEAAQKTGLGLPGVKQEFETIPKGEAALPHNYDAVQTPFNFARQYYKELIARRSLTMNKKQQEAFKKSRDDYKAAKVKLEKAFAENNVDPKIADIMRSMIEMKEGTPEYRAKENLILGREEQLQQRAVGIKPPVKKTEIKTEKETAAEVKLKEELGYKEPEISKEEKAVGRISEVQLANVRGKLNKRLKEVRDRIYGLGIKAEEKTAKERADLAKEQTRLEKQVKDIDTVLGARRTGMIVGQAQEEKGAKRYKATKTEKKMTKAGAFENAGIEPGVYAEVVKAVKENQAAAPKAPKKQARIPQAAKTLISKLADVEYRIEKEKLSPTEKSVLVREATALRKQINEELTKKQKDLEELFKIEAKEAKVDPKEYEAIMRDVDDGDFEPRVKATAPVVGLSKEAAQKVVDGTKIPKGLNVHVFAIIPEGMKQAIRAQGYNPDLVKGFVTANGDVVIVAVNNESVKDIEQTLAHEIVGHLGVEKLLGEKGMTALTTKVMNQKGGVMGLASKLGVWDEAYGAYTAALKAGKSKVEAQDQAVRELIAHVEENRVTKEGLAKANNFIKVLVGAVRAALRAFKINLDISTSDVYKLLRDARKDFNEVAPGYYKRANGEMQFRAAKPVYGPGGEAFAKAGEAILTKQQSWKDRYFPANIGLTIAQKFVSRSAGIEQVFENKGQKTSLNALQTKYYINMHDQRFAWTSEAMATGVPKLRQEEGGKGHVIEALRGANLKQLAETLGKAKWGNAEGVRNAYSLYRISKRAKRVGLDKLNFSKTEVTEKLLRDVENALRVNPELSNTFKEADKIYDQYNRDLMTFLVQTGAMSKEKADALTKDNDYIPYYRQEADGTVVLDIGGAPRIRVGNLKEQPYLHELVGGDERIVDIYAGALQNTNLLIDMALRNLATRNVAFSLADMGLLKRPVNKEGKEVGTGIHKGNGPASDTVLRFTVQPDPKYDKKNKAGEVIERDDGRRWVDVNTDSAGVPAKFVVEGLAGVNTSIPTLVKTLGVPSRLLRSWVTRNPLYAARQIIRDPFVATMANGVNTIPVLSSLKQIGKALPKVLRGESVDSDIQRRGLISSNVFTGTSEDMQKIMLQLTSGESGWETVLARADALAAQGDAATRTVAFNNFRKQGLSEMEAILATHETMPFTQRGTSSSLFLLSTMVPFMNAQIQGLNVLYKAFTGKATFQEKLKIKEKLWQRGMMMAGMTMAYALLMSDDEAYQNANDDERLNNWFVYVPGVDEPIRVPIPFELGLVFKAIPEAIINTMRGDKRADESLKALGKMVMNSVPIGPSSIPQAVKAPIEVLADYSLYTGRSIVGDRLKGVDPSERFNANTSEIAKFIGKGTGAIPVLGEYLSPVQIEYLIRGYTGSFPLAVASLTNPLLSSGAEKPTPRASELPVIGGLFQPLDATGLINRAYKDMQAIDRAGETYKKLVEEGRDADAEKYADQFADLLSLAPLAGRFRQQMGELAKQEREVKASQTMTAEQKRAELDAIRQDRIALAKDLSIERE
jgi:hypothetical protein